MHHMTWYTSTCGIKAMGLLNGLTLWSACGGGGFGSNGFVTKMQPFPIDGHYRTDVISSVGHPRSDSVVSLVLYMVCCAMVGAPALYYRFLEIVSTLLRKGNISSRPYC
jgi:hypothetical protein